jgi:hypothetical protein
MHKEENVKGLLHDNMNFSGSYFQRMETNIQEIYKTESDIQGGNTTMRTKPSPSSGRLHWCSI